MPASSSAVCLPSAKRNQANVGRSTQASLAAFPDAVRNTADVDGMIELCIATAFACPFDGEVPLDSGHRHRR